MSDFTAEDLADAIDRIVRGELERAGVDAPPVDALALAQDQFGVPVEYARPETDEYGRPRPNSRRRSGGGIILSEEMSDGQQHQVAAQAVARLLMPDVLRKIDVPPGSEGKALAAHVRGQIVGRLLVPTRLLRIELKRCGFDVLALQERFRTATPEAVALRLLDLDDPCVIAVVDDGVPAVRRSNRFPVTRKLHPAEQQCLDEVQSKDRPARVRTEGWTVQGWPIPDRPFRRVILRGVPDDV